MLRFRAIWVPPFLLCRLIFVFSFLFPLNVVNGITAGWVGITGSVVAVFVVFIFTHPAPPWQALICSHNQGSSNKAFLLSLLKRLFPLHIHTDPTGAVDAPGAILYPGGICPYTSTLWLSPYCVIFSSIVFSSIFSISFAKKGLTLGAVNS